MPPENDGEWPANRELQLLQFSRRDHPGKVFAVRHGPPFAQWPIVPQPSKRFASEASADRLLCETAYRLFGATGGSP